MINSLDSERAFEKNPTSLHNKGSEELRNTRTISQGSKASLPQTHSQHKFKIEKLKLLPL